MIPGAVALGIAVTVKLPFRPTVSPGSPRFSLPDQGGAFRRVRDRSGRRCVRVAMPAPWRPSQSWGSSASGPKPGRIPPAQPSSNQRCGCHWETGRQNLYPGLLQSAESSRLLKKIFQHKTYFGNNRSGYFICASSSFYHFKFV